MNQAEKYATTYLQDAITTIKNSKRSEELDVLTVYEKAVIYTYSGDGYVYLNEDLRKSKGANLSEFGHVLKGCLLKLPDFAGIVFRKVYLKQSELKLYEDAYENTSIIQEFAFISTTKSRLVAMQFNGTSRYVPNCVFRIYCRRGKEIEKISKFDEKEVLMLPGANFRVLEIIREFGLTVITMEEV